MKKLSLLILLLCAGLALTAQKEYTVLSDVMLMSDGSEGTETYALIESVFGNGCIEAPDLYPSNHPEVKHIVEKTDNIVGNYFEFCIHRDIDRDRDTDYTDRQRNEIKTYEPSPANLKGFKGETMRFHWYFKLQEGFTISKNFSHFFQFKAVNGDDSQPVTTISGSINSGKYEFEIIYNSGNSSSDIQLAHTDWDLANTGEWMEIEAIATFADEGYLKITISTIGGEELLSVERENIDMWRTGSTFVRPKWGIYRSLSSKSYLSPDEETAGFAHFSVQKITEELPSGIADHQLKNHLLFPNPASEQINLSFNASCSGEMKIISLNGTLVYELALETTKHHSVDISAFAPGLYLILLDGEILDRFVKY